MFTNHIYLIYMNNPDLLLDNLQSLMINKNKPIHKRKSPAIDKITNVCLHQNSSISNDEMYSRNNQRRKDVRLANRMRNIPATKIKSINKHTFQQHIK